MNRYLAFLRGMNLGRRRIKNDELCAIFEGMGYTDVSAFLASGNVIFDSSETDSASVANRVESRLQASLGYEVPTVLRTSGEVRAIAAHTPFQEVPSDARGKIQVAMFNAKIGDSAHDAILEMSTDDDRLELTSRELYWMPKGNL